MKLSTKKRIKKVWDVSDTIFSWLCVVFAVVIVFSFFSAKNHQETFYIFNHNATVILTESMEPEIATGGIVVTRKVETMDELEVGDIITYTVYDQNNKAVNICHRIRAITDDGVIVTKGDNNRKYDSYRLTFDNVNGEVVSIWNGVAPITTKLISEINPLFTIPGIGFVVTWPRIIAIFAVLTTIIALAIIQKQLEDSLEESIKAQEEREAESVEDEEGNSDCDGENTESADEIDNTPTENTPTPDETI